MFRYFALDPFIAAGRAISEQSIQTELADSRLQPPTAGAMMGIRG
jgi:hypothetical protein